MITLNASGGSITFEFSGNSTYLNDGTITVPVNSLALIIDESNMATFRKAASNDIFVSANIAEFGMTKAELESWFKENAVGSTGGGGSDTVDGASLFGGTHYANEETSIKYFNQMLEGQKPSALKFVARYSIDNTYSSAITITLYDTQDYNEHHNTLTISLSGGAVTSITEANGGSFTGITVDNDWVLRPAEGYFFNSYQWLINRNVLGLRILPKDGVIESGSTTDVIENGIYKQLQRHEENIGNLAISAVTSTNLSFKYESGITLTTNKSSTALAVDDSLKYTRKLGVYVTGDTYTNVLNSESATTYINLDGKKNVDMWLNQSYTGTPSGWYTISVQNLDGAGDYYLYENDAFTLGGGSAGSTLNYDSSTGKVSITCPSGISSINNGSKFAPADDLTNADCFIGLVSYTSNEYTIQDAIDSKVNVSDNVVSAYSFDKSTKIYYPGITAERTPSIPSGTKKISIGFTMLPANNQLFETLQFVTFNPFNIVDVASGLTVGVSEDMSTFPITYTITSVTWTGDDSIMAYDLSENDTLLNLYALGEYQLAQAKPKGMNSLEMYIDVLEDIESGQTAEVVNDGVVKNFENIGKYLQDERNRVDNKIDNKLDATAYTPVVSSIMQGSTNPVEGGTLWDELRVQTSPGQGETTITFDSSNYSTNYPLGCTSLKVNVGAVDEFVSIYFYNSSNTNLGEISVANFGGIEVKRNTLPGATYEISGNIVTLSYPAQGIVKIEKMYSENFSFSAVNPPVYDTLKNVVDGKQDQLIAGNNITISGNVISAEGCVKAIEAGRGISITTGETADTVSFNLPISAGTGVNSIIENHNGNIASGDLSHAEGAYSVASGPYSHAEGNSTTANASGSHTEGSNTLASGNYAHAEGNYTTATTIGAHSEGSGTIASGRQSHAEGYNTTASGDYSHAEGWGTSASGDLSHAEGSGTLASGDYSHAEGNFTIASNSCEHASGRYNVSSSASTTFGDSGNTLFSVGNGTSTADTHNAFEIRQNGDIYFEYDGNDIKLQDKLDEIESVTAAALVNLNEALGGLSLVKLTESEYTGLATKDPNVLYVVIPDPTNP